MTTLAQAPYSLAYGDDIKAKVLATNSRGSSSASSASTSFVTLQTVPQAPETPQRNSATSDAQIVVDWTALGTN